MKLFFYPIDRVGNLLASFYHCSITWSTRPIDKHHQAVDILLAQRRQDAPQLLRAVEGKDYHGQWWHQNLHLLTFSYFLSKICLILANLCRAW